jgi:predicted TIM-barrel fold metal-dependent hydrolase
VSKLIDFHTHIYPSVELPGPLEGIRNLLRAASTPVSKFYHATSLDMRSWSKQTRRLTEEVGLAAVLPMLLIESSRADHRKAMKKSGVDAAVVVAHMPLISNEFTIEVCKEDDHLIPAIQIPKESSFDEKKWKNFIKSNGVKLIKIHPLADGLPPKSEHYTKILNLAVDTGCSVIVHTGKLHSKFFFKDHKNGRVEFMTDWFVDFPQLNFILAHMNMGEPEALWNVTEKHNNLYATTSWQSADTILESIKRMGAERILFASDWPLLGDNMRIASQRMQKITSEISKDEAELISYKNAQAILGLKL